MQPPRCHAALAVDDSRFRHENVATYWLSWADPAAEAAIRERTAALTTAGGPASEDTLSNLVGCGWVDKQLLCC